MNLLEASRYNVLDIEAVMPVSEAISKKVSGVVSPKPNLPKEVEANLNLSMELSWKITSLLNVHSPVIVWEAEREAGPLV